MAGLPESAIGRNPDGKYPDIEWVYATANEPGKQTSDIEDMMTQNVNGLVLLATEPNAIAPVAKKAKDRGIFLVSVDRGSDTLTPVVDVFLEGDNKAFGKKSAEYIVERLEGQRQDRDPARDPFDRSTPIAMKRRWKSSMPTRVSRCCLLSPACGTSRRRWK